MSNRATDRHRWKRTFTAALASALLTACGGGGGGPSPAAAPPVVGPDNPGAPVATNNTAVDGRNWINYRRSQAGLSVLTQHPVVDKAAQAHSDYQRLNDEITHTEVSGRPGFTGVNLEARLRAAGYAFAGESAFGEVISATASNSGFYMAEELITAIYHRFVIFEPRFEEIGTGSGTTGGGYTYFTANFTANNGFGPGLGANVTVWPFPGQTGVAPNFFSDLESPDPIPDRNVNEVGYPVSVQGDLDAVLTTTSFTMRERGAAANLTVRLLTSATDINTKEYAAAIIPMTRLKANTSYDVSFSGTIRGTPVNKNWSFTTK